MRRSIAPPRQRGTDAESRRVVRRVPMERAWATAKVWIAHGGASSLSVVFSRWLREDVGRCAAGGARFTAL
jgi:hypothetical protein